MLVVAWDSVSNLDIAPGLNDGKSEHLRHQYADTSLLKTGRAGYRFMMTSWSSSRQDAESNAPRF